MTRCKARMYRCNVAMYGFNGPIYRCKLTMCGYNAAM